jgi:hypothetical protein
MTRSGILPHPVERPPEPKPPRLLDQLSQAARQRSTSEPTMAQLVDWTRRFSESSTTARERLHGLRTPFAPRSTTPR